MNFLLVLNIYNVNIFIFKDYKYEMKKKELGEGGKNDEVFII